MPRKRYGGHIEFDQYIRQTMQIHQIPRPGVGAYGLCVFSPKSTPIPDNNTQQALARRSS